MDRRSFIKTAALGLTATATGIQKTEAGLLLPTEHIVSEMSEVVGHGTLVNISIESQVNFDKELGMLGRTTEIETYLELSNFIYEDPIIVPQYASVLGQLNKVPVGIFDYEYEVTITRKIKLLPDKG